MLNIDELLIRFTDSRTGIEGASISERRLSDLVGIFADQAAYAAALAEGDPIIYTVQTIEAGEGEGDLHLGLGTLMPGAVGGEYYMTKGHFHAWRPAAEIYIGIAGSGGMLLESEDQGETRYLPLTPNTAIYVPGFTAHRTINTGTEPLIYLGIYPARAGHDYGAIAERNFRMMVADVAGIPTVMARGTFSPPA